MGISECGPRVFAHVRTEVQLGDFKGKRLAVDIASFKQKAWYQDVCSYYRANEPATHGYRATLARLLSVLAAAAGGVSNVTVCLDGGRFPPKSREHDRRGSTATARAEILAAAEAKDAANQRKDADYEYHKLAYPPPPFVDAWLIAHCQEHRIPLVVAPQEADSQAAQLVRDDRADVLVTIDSDLLFYPGVTQLLLADTKKAGVWWTVKLADIVDSQVGTLSFVGFNGFDLRSVAVAAGGDYSDAPHPAGMRWRWLQQVYTARRQIV